MKRSLQLLMAGIAVVAAVGLATAVCTDTMSSILSASGCAPSPREGEVVDVCGTVYGPQGTWNSGTVYFTDGVSGLGFYAFPDSPYVATAVGDYIEVHGEVGAYYSEIQIVDIAFPPENFSYVITSSGNPVAPNKYSIQEALAGGLITGGYNLVHGIVTSTNFDGAYN